MGRPKKDSSPIALKIATPVYNRLNDYCGETGATKTAVIERAITEFLDKSDAERKIVKQHMK